MTYRDCKSDRDTKRLEAAETSAKSMLKLCDIGMSCTGRQGLKHSHFQQFQHFQQWQGTKTPSGD